MRLYGLLILILTVSCSNNQQKETPTEKALEVAGALTSDKADTVCYYRTEGTTNQDTALIMLISKNELVSGKMMNLPHETDSRVGKLVGVKEGDIVNGLWTYMQEGMIDSVEVSFKASGDNLVQKPAIFDPKLGSEVLPDTATYRVEFTRCKCEEVPMLFYDLGKIGL